MSIQIGRATLGGRLYADGDDVPGRQDARLIPQGRAGGVAVRRGAESDGLIVGAAIFTGRWRDAR